MGGGSIRMTGMNLNFLGRRVQILSLLGVLCLASPSQASFLDTLGGLYEAGKEKVGSLFQRGKEAVSGLLGGGSSSTSSPSPASPSAPTSSPPPESSSPPPSSTSSPTSASSSTSSSSATSERRLLDLSTQVERAQAAVSERASNLKDYFKQLGEKGPGESARPFVEERVKALDKGREELEGLYQKLHEGVVASGGRLSREVRDKIDSIQERQGGIAESLGSIRGKLVGWAGLSGASDSSSKEAAPAASPAADSSSDAGSTDKPMVLVDKLSDSSTSSPLDSFRPPGERETEGIPRTEVAADPGSNAAVARPTESSSETGSPEGESSSSPSEGESNSSQGSADGVVPEDATPTGSGESSSASDAEEEEKPFDPNDPEVLSRIDQWLSMAGLDPYGRTPGPGIRFTRAPDGASKGRGAYVWDIFKDSSRGIGITLREFVEKAGATAPKSSGTKAPAASSSATGKGSLPSEEKNKDYLQLMKSLKVGDRDAIEKDYGTYSDSK